LQPLALRRGDEGESGKKGDTQKADSVNEAEFRAHGTTPSVVVPNPS
jgi:hypothetical protein